MSKVGCFWFLPGRARGPTTRRPKQTHTICYSALVGGGRRACGPHLAAAVVSHTLSAEHVGRGGCSNSLFFVPAGPGAWSNRAAPQTNPHYLVFRVGWRGAPRIWTTPCRRGGPPNHFCSGGPGASQKRMQSMPGQAQGKPKTYAAYVFGLPRARPSMLGRARGQPKTYAKHARAIPGPAKNVCKA